MDVVKRFLISAVWAIPTSAIAQHGVGITVGRDLIFPKESAGISDLNAFSLGLICTDLAGDRSSWRGTLEWVRRTYLLQGYMDADLWYDMDVRTDYLHLSFAGRIPLSPKNIVTFDIEPVIGYRFAQERNGIAYYRGYASTDTLYYVQDPAVDGSFCEARLRIGLSADIPVAEKILVALGAHLGWGGGNWAPGPTITGWDYQFRVGVEYMMGHKGR